jgi:hypothetical protein
MASDQLSQNWSRLQDSIGRVAASLRSFVAANPEARTPVANVLRGLSDLQIASDLLGRSDNGIEAEAANIPANLSASIATLRENCNGLIDQLNAALGQSQRQPEQGDRNRTAQVRSIVEQVTRSVEPIEYSCLAMNLVMDAWML